MPRGSKIREGFAGQRMIVLPRPVVRAALSEMDLVPTDVGYFPQADGHYVERHRGVPQMIVIHCVRGGGWASVDQTRVDIAPGQVLVIPPNLPHAYAAQTDHPWTIYWLHAAGRRIAPILRLLTDNGQSPVFPVGSDPEIPSLFDEVLDTLHQSCGNDNLLLASLAAGRLLGKLIADRRSHPQQPATAQRIARTIAFMQSRLATSICVAELAGIANLSASHFAWAFKRQTGYPVLDFFIRLRMQKAAQLLDTTSQPIKAIASELGFDDPLYFSRRFRKVHAMCPNQYRAIKKG